MKPCIFAPVAALLASWAAFAAYVVKTTPQLPANVATHFGGSGAANGWMTRDVHLAFILGMGFGVPLFIAGLYAVLSRLGNARINIPHRDHWLAPERRQATLDFLLAHGLWFASLMVAFMGGVQWMLIEANRATPPHLAGAHLGAVVGVFLAAVAAWIAVLFWRFARVR